MGEQVATAGPMGVFQVFRGVPGCSRAMFRWEFFFLGLFVSYPDLVDKLGPK